MTNISPDISENFMFTRTGRVKYVLLVFKPTEILVNLLCRKFDDRSSLFQNWPNINLPIVITCDR